MIAALLLLVAGRRLTWHSQLSVDAIECDNVLVEEILSNETGLLSSTIFQSMEADVRTCCRIAIVLFAYLTGLVYNTSATRIRTPLLHMMLVLDRMDLESLWYVSPRVLIWVLYIGAYASYGQNERRWFVTQLVNGARKTGIKSWAEISETLNRFINLNWSHEELFHGIWEEVNTTSYKIGTLVPQLG